MSVPSPCIEAGCYSTAIKESRCQAHQREPFAGTYRKERLPKDWQVRRRMVFQRDGRICYLCGEDGADTVDHVIAGDDHRLENLKPVHDRTPPHCHRAKTQQESMEARKVKPFGWGIF